MDFIKTSQTAFEAVLDELLKERSSGSDREQIFLMLYNGKIQKSLETTVLKQEKPASFK